MGTNPDPPLRLGWTRRNPSQPVLSMVAVCLQGFPQIPKGQACASPCLPCGAREAPPPGPQGAVVMGMLGLWNCLLGNRTPRSVTMATASTQHSMMGTGFPSLSEDFPSGAGRAVGTALPVLLGASGTGRFQPQTVASPPPGKVPGPAGTFCSQAWQRLPSEGIARGLRARPDIP